MKFKETLLKIETVISAIAFAVLIIVTTANVICRLIFLKTLSWAEEVSYLFFNWAVFFGACILYARQGLIAIDVLVDHLPSKMRHVTRAISFALIFVMCVILVIWGVKFSINAWGRPTSFLKIPYFFFDISVPITATIMAGYSVDFFLQCVRGKDVASLALEDRA